LCVDHILPAENKSMRTSGVLFALFLLGSAVTLSPNADAQPPGAPGQPAPRLDKALPVVPKSAGAFVTLKVSDLVRSPDFKPVLEQLAKQPDALDGFTEVVGVSPLDIDRITLFWPRSFSDGPGDSVLVLTTREPFNEARVLKALRARPVYDERGGRWEYGASKPQVSVKGFAPPPAANVAEPAKEPPPEPPPPKSGRPSFSLRQKNDEPAPPGEGPSDPLFYVLERGAFEVLLMVDDRTLVFLPGRKNNELTVMALLGSALKKNASGPLADALAAAEKHTFAAGVYLPPVFKEFDRRTPPELVPYTALAAARTAVLVGNLEKATTLTLTLKFETAAAAKRAAPVLEEGISTVAEKLTKEADEMKASRRSMDAAAAPLLSLLGGALKKAQVKQDGERVVASTEAEVGPVAAKAMAELLRGVQSRKQAQARMQNLKIIGLALLNYESVNGRFPANVYGPKGELLLSWRVQLLPYLEADDLYRQFKLDEPWDSENNKKLLDKMPKVFQALDRDAPKGSTFYQGFIGPNPQLGLPKDVFGRAWLAVEQKEGIRIVEITDGTSNTLAVVEARDAVPWTKPVDLPLGGPVPHLGEKGAERAPVLRFDGSTFLLPTNLKPDQFWPRVTINGGEIVEDVEDDVPFGIRRRPAVPAVGAGGRDGEKGPMAPELANLSDAVDAAKRELNAAANEVERIEVAFKNGTANAEDRAKATTVYDAAARKLKLLQQQLDNVRADQERPKVPPPPK
jgi:hypothetical protein